MASFYAESRRLPVFDARPRLRKRRGTRMTKRAARVIGLAAVASALGTVGLADAQTLVIHVRDYAQISKAELADARKEVTKIYERSGVHAVW
jgi:hypothetical protein